MIHNEVLDCIRARRSTRRFQERQIEAGHLEAILEAAIWAPSGSNSQSWLFTAIQDGAVLSKINELVREGFQHWTPDDDYPAKLGARAAAQRKDYHFFYHAPTLIIASNRPDYENAMADCSLALENLSGALADDFFKLRTGLAGSVLQKFINYNIKAALVIPDNQKVKGKFKELLAESNKGNSFRVFNSKDEAEAWLCKD